MAEPYPQNAGTRTSGRGRSVSPQAHQAAVMHPNHVHALLALASSIVVAGPGFRRNPIRDPLRDVMEPSFRTHTPRARKGRYNGLSPVDPFPQIDRTPPSFLRTGVALSFLARTSYTNQEQRQQSTSHQHLTSHTHVLPVIYKWGLFSPK